MCTVSFVPTARGFYLAMNRDEKRTRAPGLPPALVSSGGRRAIFPREPDGGTWIGINDAGICLALINWHRISRKPKLEARSRGLVIDSLITSASLQQIGRSLKQLPLAALNPFRLLAADSRTRQLVEWQWNLEQLHKRKHPWHVAHWFSSGFNEREAERVRTSVCARNGASASLAALRRLHRSHAPRRGAFSICMHRADAVTVSYAEFIVTPRRATMRYARGPPCLGVPLVTRSLGL